MSDIENLAGDTRPIGVFDSGLGGLTVARAIATALPHESVYYFGDTKRCPYGTRTEDEVRSIALQAGRWLSKHDVKIMVIACNTATAAALRLAQQVLDVPVDRRDRAGRTCGNQQHAHASRGRARHQPHHSLGAYTRPFRT
ncbi:MAG: glutamate racemase [Collinsella sp.]